MNAQSPTENQVPRQALLPFLLSLAFVGVAAVIMFATAFAEDPLSRQHAVQTKTAIALTADALMGPFPTATRPTATASLNPSPTWTATLTPTLPPSSTPTRFIPTFTRTPRTRESGPSSGGPTSPANTSAAPTSTARPPTSVPATDVPPDPGPIVTSLPPVIQTLLP